MKALSIQQPWAWAIVNGFKPVENRTWRTNYTGPLLIHAGKRELKTDVYSMARLVAGEVSDSDPIEVIEKYRDERVLGAIVGACVLKKCVDELDLDFPYTATTRFRSGMGPAMVDRTVRVCSRPAGTRSKRRRCAASSGSSVPEEELINDA